MIQITQDLVKSKLPKRPIDASKGTFGKVLVIAGSKNFPGAAILSVIAAARIGASSDPIVVYADCICSSVGLIIKGLLNKKSFNPDSSKGNF